RFAREAAILEELGEHHPQIPTLYAYFEADGQFYLVQEYIEGDTLTQRIQQQGTFSESSVKELLSELLTILDYVHSRKIIHRDIKPDNIILPHGNSKPVLIDFGAVRETMGTVATPSGSPTSSIVIGTPGFMPSEQNVGRPVFSSDLYALGLTGIYLLTGKVPQDLESDHLTGEITWRQYAVTVSPTLAEILDKAIQSHPRERFATAKQMLDALYNRNANILPTVTSPSPSSPPSTPQTVVTQPSPKSSPNLINSLIIGGLLAVGIIGGFALTNTLQSNSTSETTNPESSPQPSNSPAIQQAENAPPPTSQTPSQATPNPSPSIVIKPQTPPSQPTIERSSPTQFVENHYLLLNQRQYEVTWQRLSTKFQGISQGYTGYTNWWNKVQEINIGAVDLVDLTPERAVVKADLYYIMKQGNDFKDTKPMIYLIWDENKNNWLIHEKK
ncbi:protein kinase, partial [Spirulina sp. CS-785/01]|uniref:serine/threonine protein kinase n=1 Tax=Spirulina sp. CS-785/01 TaxID=3021716 RepID=UPI00232FF2FA